MLTPQLHPAPCHLLVVDDHADNREMLRAMLEFEGYVVDVAENGQEALEILSRGHFDVVLTDLWMPVMDGAEFIQAARKDAKTADLPVIMMSGAFDSAFPADIAADAFLRKPLGLSPLLSALARFNCSTRR